jgi:hypothetical protein
MTSLMLTISRKAIGYANNRNKYVRQGERFSPSFVADEAEAETELKSLAAAGVFSNLYTFAKAELYDAAAFRADPLNTKPIKTYAVIPA